MSAPIDTPPPVGLDDQIKCLKREIALRKNVYRGWVASGRMKQESADHEIAAMTAALHTVMGAQEITPERIAAAVQGYKAARDNLGGTVTDDNLAHALRIALEFAK